MTTMDTEYEVTFTIKTNVPKIRPDFDGVDAIIEALDYGLRGLIKNGLYQMVDSAVVRFTVPVEEEEEEEEEGQEPEPVAVEPTVPDPVEVTVVAVEPQEEQEEEQEQEEDPKPIYGPPNPSLTIARRNN